MFCGKTMSSPSQLRGQNPRVNGFALILTNDYEGMSDKLLALKGTRIDGQKMLDTLLELKALGTQCKCHCDAKINSLGRALSISA